MIKIASFDPKTGENTVAAEVSWRDVAASIRKPGDFAEVLQCLVNSFSTGFKHGFEVGEELHSAHPTLQHLIVDELLGILTALAYEDYVDARNEKAIEACRKIRELDLKTGAMI